MVSIVKLHKKARLLSLEQRWEKQLLGLMYGYSNLDDVWLVRERVTRNNQKFVFKTETRFGPKYENSPFYRGTVLWNKLQKDVQLSDNVFMFKIGIAKQYKTFRG